jgi:protein disulfide-isomerase A1
VHYFVGSDKERSSYVKEMRPVAKRYAEYLILATTDANEYPEMLEMLGFKKGTSGILLLENPSNGDIFLYKGKKKIKAEVVDQFINEVVDGKVEPWNKQKAQRQGSRHEEL